MSVLQDRRKALGFSLRDVEEITKGRISNAYLSQLENGQIKSPSVGVAVELAATYAVPAETMLEWLGHPAQPARVLLCETCGQAIRATSDRKLTDTSKGAK